MFIEVGHPMNWQRNCIQLKHIYCTGSKTIWPVILDLTKCHNLFVQIVAPYKDIDIERLNFQHVELLGGKLRHGARSTVSLHLKRAMGQRAASLDHVWFGY